VCKCQNCLANIKHNWSKMSEDLQADTPASRARARLMSVVKIVVAFFKYVGLFFIGIMTGMGIVLKNPPEDKAAKKQIFELVAENDSLKKNITQIKSINQPSDKPIEKETISFD
jgi:hypothetical protein